MRLVLVEWVDHCEAEGNVWMTAEEAADCQTARNRSVGWLVHLDATRLILTGSHVVGEDTVARPLVLAVPCVVRVIDLVEVPA